MKIVTVLDFDDVAEFGHLSASFPWVEPTGRCTYIAFTMENEKARGGHNLYVLCLISNREIHEPIMNFGLAIESVLKKYMNDIREIIKNNDLELCIKDDLELEEQIQNQFNSILENVRNDVFELLKEALYDVPIIT